MRAATQASANASSLTTVHRLVLDALVGQVLVEGAEEEGSSIVRAFLLWWGRLGEAGGSGAVAAVARSCWPIAN